MYIYEKPFLRMKSPILQVLVYILVLCSYHLIAQTELPSSSEHNLMQPPFLKAGDTVAIVAPSGVLNNREREVNQAIDLLKRWKLNVVVGEHVYSKDDHFAGTDLQRAADLQKVMDDPSISAIWCARGGYGTVRVLDQLDYYHFNRKPKWLIGYSDITALHNQLHNQGVQSIHALMCTSLTEDESNVDNAIETFRKAIFGDELSYSIEGSTYNKVGFASGQLVGGNLTLLHTMLGSETSIDTSGKILFIEEIGEYKYHIDRMLQSLKRAGYFENLAGVVVGDFSNMRKNTTPWGTSIEQLILDVFENYDYPILFHFPAGHEKDNRALILGKAVNLTVNKTQSSISFN